jgi:hypothetical protein
MRLKPVSGANRFWRDGQDIPVVERTYLAANTGPYGKEARTAAAIDLGYLQDRQEIHMARQCRGARQKRRIEKAAQEFKTDAWRLYAVQRR